MNEFHNEVYTNNVTLGNKNLFTSDKIVPNVFIPNQIKLNSSSSDSNDNKVFEFTCKDININAINHFLVEINLKELRGKGSLAYQKNLAYQLINSFKISSVNNKKNDCVLLNQREIFNNVKNLNDLDFNKLSTQAGTNKKLCNFTTSNNESGLLKPRTTIYAKIRLPFDNSVTEALKFPKGCELLITLSLKSINDAICYNSTYMTHLTPKDMFESVKLYAHTYNVLLGEHIPSTFIEHEEVMLLKPGVIKNMATNKNDSENRIHEETKNITRCVSSIKLISDAMLSGKRFLAYPGYNQSESNWLTTYHTKIISELIISVDEDVEIVDYIKDNYKVNPINHNNFNFNNPILIPINEVKNIEIEILNIPKDKKLYFHSNILGYNYTHFNNDTKLMENIVTNISSKFTKIQGEFYYDSLRFNNIESELSMIDISTPLEIWNSQNGFNNRSKYSELDYVIINNHFISGLDFLGKYQPLKELSFYIDTDLTTNRDNRSLTGFKEAAIYLINNLNKVDKYPQDYYYKYSHNLMMVRPNNFRINKTITILLMIDDYKNQVNEYDINYILKIFSLKEIKIKDNVVLSEYILH